MKELNQLHEGLINSNTLVIKKSRSGLVCSFLKEGFVNQVVEVRDEVLSSMLSQAGLNGIVEGMDFQVFRNTFDSFSLRVKARKLYKELATSLPDISTKRLASTSAA